MSTTVDHQVQPVGYCSVDKYLTLIDIDKMDRSHCMVTRATRRDAIWPDS